MLLLLDAAHPSASVIISRRSRRTLKGAKLWSKFHNISSNWDTEQFPQLSYRCKLCG